jgi:hypothetical protein
LGVKGVPDYKNDEYKGYRVVDIKTNKTLFHTTSELSHWFKEILYASERSLSKDNGELLSQSLVLWDARSRRSLALPPTPEGTVLERYYFSPDENTIALYYRKFGKKLGEKSKFGILKLWNYRENRVVWSHKTKNVLKISDWSPDGKKLVAFVQPEGIRNYFDPRTLYVFDAEGKVCYERDIAQEYYRWSPDSKKLGVRLQTVDENGEPLVKAIEIKHFDD